MSRRLRLPWGVLWCRSSSTTPSSRPSRPRPVPVSRSRTSLGRLGLSWRVETSRRRASEKICGTCQDVKNREQSIIQRLFIFLLRRPRLRLGLVLRTPIQNVSPDTPSQLSILPVREFYCSTYSGPPLREGRM